LRDKIVLHHFFVGFRGFLVGLYSLIINITEILKVIIMSFKNLCKIDYAKILPWILWFFLVLLSVITASGDPTVPPPGVM